MIPRIVSGPWLLHECCNCYSGRNWCEVTHMLHDRPRYLMGKKLHSWYKAPSLYAGLKAICLPERL